MKLLKVHGMKYKHYAPKTKCLLARAGKRQIEKINDFMANNPANYCILGFSEDQQYIKISNDKFINLGRRKNLEEVSSNVFCCLRKIDRLSCDIAIIEGLEEKNLGLSIMNRLIRACENNII